MGEARSELDLALRADPGPAGACLSVGIVESQGNENAQTVDDLRRAAELLPDRDSRRYP